MISSIEGLSVLVTGSSKGIGKGIATSFAASGARVTVVARTEAAAMATVEEIKQAGGTAIACAADVTKRDQMDAAVAASVEAFVAWTCSCQRQDFPVRQSGGNDRRPVRSAGHQPQGDLHQCSAALPALKKSWPGAWC